MSKSQVIVTSVGAVFTIAIACYVVVIHRRISSVEADLLTEVKLRAQAEKIRLAERTGRITAEKRLTEALKQVPESNLKRLGNKTAQVFQHCAIGQLESCFRSRFGTPRQGCIVQEARARLKISPVTGGKDALEGLEQYSHVWLLFIFHENTNGAATVKTKVVPPKFGEKVGVYSTRSPHRTNAIGLSLARLSHIDGDVLYFDGVDLVDGTPILDIKPYIRWDAPDNARYPDWIDVPKVKPFSEVLFTEEAIESITYLLPSTKLYADVSTEYMCQFIANILREDIRSEYTRATKGEDTVFSVWLDIMTIQWMAEGSTVRVVGAKAAT